MAQTVLIAAPEHLAGLKEHGFADALAFSDLDALKALEAITREKPPVIALDSPKSLVAGLGAPKVIVHEGTLEDVFMSLTGRHLRDE